MPSQSILMLRFSFLYLIVAVSLGGVLLFHKVQPLHPGVWALLPIHFETAIWGWLIQFVMGTAYWMFPRHLEGEARGSTVLAWVMIAFLNTGILLLITGYLPVTDLLNLKAAGRALILSSILLFGWLVWNRVVSYRNLKHKY